jgi:valyl-tRNA synthetase
VAIFEDLMKVLHPFMPFISEEIWQQLAARKQGESICVAAMPAYTANIASLDLSYVTESITQIRNLRNAKGMSPKETLDIWIKTQEQVRYEGYLSLITKLANIQFKGFVLAQEEATMMLPCHTDEVYVKLNLVIDAAAEKEKIAKEIEYLEGFMQSVDAKLSNEKFVANAKPELVEKERQKRSDAAQKLAALQASLNSL